MHIQSTPISALCSAIARRSVLRFVYDGRGQRTVEPYLHGFTTAGSEVICGFQIAGHSESGNPSGWKMFDVSRISMLEEEERTFLEPRTGYKAGGKGIVRIHCCV